MQCGSRGAQDDPGSIERRCWQRDPDCQFVDWELSACWKRSNPTLPAHIVDCELNMPSLAAATTACDTDGIVSHTIWVFDQLASTQAWAVTMSWLDSKQRRESCWVVRCYFLHSVVIAYFMLVEACEMHARMLGAQVNFETYNIKNCIGKQHIFLKSF